MIVTAWNNGKYKESGAGYGLRILKEDRDSVFLRKWDHIILDIDGKEVAINLSDSFWRNCSELRSKEIGKWLISTDKGKWEKGKPPKYQLTQISNNKFKLR